MAGFNNERLSPMRVRCNKIDFVRLCDSAEETWKAVHECGDAISEVHTIDLDDPDGLARLAIILHYGFIHSINVAGPYGKKKSSMTSRQRKE